MREALSAIAQEEAALEPTAERKRLLQSITDIRTSFALSVGSMREFLATGDPSCKREFDGFRLEHQHAFQEAQGLTSLLSKTQRPQWDRYALLRAEFEPLVAKVFALREAKDWNRAIDIWENESRPRMGALKDALERIAQKASINLASAKDEVHAAGDLVDLSLIVATAAAILIGCAVAVVSGRKIAFAARMLADRAKEISTGDLTGDNLLLKSTDELGELAGGFNVMLGNLKDLTKQILAVTESVNSATTQIASSTKQQASSTKEQAATVQQITTTMKELSQSGAQIVEKAKEVAAAAETVSETSRSGIDAVLGTNRTMDAIREQVEEVAENIVALSEKTQAVGEIIATVNDIAEQSNLLALNASIEAASAGDDGNRFSVVASEMKSLADQAKECTVQVRGILGEIQKGINSAVMLTEEAVKRVDAGKQQADVSERTIRDMVTTTQASVEAYQQIIGATNQQQVGYEQVSKGMQDIDLAARQTATSTAQLEQALSSLSAMSHQLRAAVTTYRV
jgi:methyl-accepting chemotaxis protein